jgi:hypothetical protein
MTVFAVGDAVTWISQAQGNTKRKDGIVVAYVAPGERPDRVAFPDLYTGPGCGWGRDGESYVVAVGRKHYWPIASKLNLGAACPTCKGTGVAP